MVMIVIKVIIGVNAFKTIDHAAVDNVVNGGIIYLAGVTHNVTSEVRISKTVAIVGQKGTIITNNRNGVGVFEITANNVEIINCTFANNTVSNYAGVIDNSGKNFTVSNCTFINNTLSYGSTIHSSGWGLSIC